ncbi:hypothetical protein RR48_13015 [Papilio machaon]|uniref:Uncharacterized protein n=1 Tax=Papilio machaon TaxID=76193 RepID=A0A194QXH4_PAPMA|nr:hypothetical protein RR48_13015 [Papilio machaon]
MKMLWWMYGVPRLDTIRNELVLGSLGVRDIADKMQENPEADPKLDVVLKDKSECQVSDEGVEDRAKWKKLIRKADTTTMWITS